jgi:DNA-binding HxlR family transcriptional regulator
MAGTGKREESEAHNEAACPTVEAVEQIGSEWRLLVLHDLQDGEKRFNELKRSTGASSRTLSRVLDDLEESGLVDRRVEERPIASYYSLTKKGTALCPVLEELGDWADEWVEVDGPA